MSISSTNPSSGMNYTPPNQNEVGSSSSTSNATQPQNAKTEDVASTSSSGGAERAKSLSLKEALLELLQKSDARRTEIRQDAETRANAPGPVLDTRAQLPDMESFIRNIDDRTAAQARARVAPQPRRLGHMQEFLEESLMGRNHVLLEGSSSRGLPSSSSNRGLVSGSSSHGLTSSSPNRNLDSRPLETSFSSLDLESRLREMVGAHFARNSASGLAVIDGRDGISQHTQPPEYGFEAPISDVERRAVAARGEEIMRQHAEAARADIERIPVSPVPMTGNEPTWNRLDDDVLPRVRMGDGEIVTRLTDEQRKSAQECESNPFEALNPGIANYAPAFETALSTKPEVQSQFAGHDYTHLSTHVKNAEGLYTDFKAAFNRSGTVRTVAATGAAVVGDLAFGAGIFTATTLAGPAVLAANGAALGSSVHQAIRAGDRGKARNILNQVVREQQDSLAAVNPGDNAVHGEALVSVLGRQGAEKFDTCRHELRSNLNTYLRSLGNLERGAFEKHEAPFEKVDIPGKGERLVASHYRFQSLLEELATRVRR